MLSANTKEQIVQLEKEYWQALQDGNVDAAMRLTEDPCLVTGPQGLASIDQKTFAEMMKAANWSLKRFEFKGKPEILGIGDDVAIIAYQVREELVVDGKPVALEAAEASTWVRHNGSWKCALHTEALAGDPFGRDRVIQEATTPSLAQEEAVANIAVKDLNAARKFYEEIIGLTPIRTESDELIVYRNGKSALYVYRSQYAGTNKATALTWTVSNVDETVRSLKDKGVSFEHYDLPDTKREGDIHISGDMRMAWFKDPDGNIFCITSR